jgi:cytochrome c biogenesis factor
VTVVGELSLWVALFLAVWGSAASFGGAATRRPELVTSGVRSVVAAAVMVALACLGLLAALLTHDFSLEYVASHTTLNMPTFYLITALWAGPAGARLSFALALSVSATAAVSARRRVEATGSLPWVVGALAATLALVLVAVCFVTNPYDRVEWVPAEGAGLSPRLQSPLALPFLVATYGAYGAAALLFGLAVGAVATGKVDDGWYSAVRRWSVISWCLMTVSIAVRTRWTYLEPVAGGLWRPDVAQLANAAAWVLSFVLLRSFAVRAGAPAARYTASIALAVFGFVLVGAALVPRPPGPPDESSVAPPAAMLALIGFAVVGAGAIYSGVRRLPSGVQGLAVIKARRPLGSLMVYTGFGMLLTGLVARGSWTEHTVRLRAGAATQLTDPFAHRWRFVSQGVSRDERMNYLSTGVALEAWRDGRKAGIVSAERRQYIDSFQRPTFEPAPRPGIRSTLGLDVYVVLAEVRGETAHLRVGFRPLVAFVWIGWIVIAIGGLALGLALGSSGQRSTAS